MIWLIVAITLLVGLVSMLRMSYAKHCRLIALCHVNGLLYRFENDGEPDRLQIVDDVRYCMERATSHVTEYLSELRDLSDENKEWVLSHYMLASPTLREDIRSAVKRQKFADRIETQRQERIHKQFHNTARDLGVKVDEAEHVWRDTGPDTFETVETWHGETVHVMKNSMYDTLHEAVWNGAPSLQHRRERLSRSLPEPQGAQEE